MIAAAVLFAGVACAEEVADRTGIESTIRAFSVMPGREALYTSDFDHAELYRYMKAAGTPGGAIPITVDGAPGTVVISKEPMGEADWFPAGFPAGAQAPLALKKIRFVTADVAIVDGLGKAPVLLVVRKVGTDWKIASVRMLAEN